LSKKKQKLLFFMAMRKAV